MHEVSSGESIAAEDMLLRRVFQNYIRRDGTLRPTAFMTSSKGAEPGRIPDPRCSVYIERLTTHERVLAVAPQPMRLARLEASVPMGMYLDVVRMPHLDVLGSAEHAHSEILGMTTKAQCDELAENCEIIPE